MTEAPHGRAMAAPDLTPRTGGGPATPHLVARERVTAVVVTRGVTEYLADTLAALAAQTRPPDRVLLVDAAAGAQPGALAQDAGVTDELHVLAAAVPTRLVAAPGVRTFGGAVRAALADDPGDGGASVPDWLWLLHDDAAPEPGALAALVRAVEAAPSVGVAGCKQRLWHDPARVVEVGVTTSRFGRRMTGIEEPEVDQGQHDARDDVLAVGLAGALVRRDVWDALGGPDPALGPFGDGLDLSRRARLAGHRVVVVPEAVVRHAQASLVGTRPGWDVRRSARARREAFLHAQLVQVPWWLVPVVVLLAIASGVVRGLGRFATKEPHLVAGELTAPWRVLATPGRVARARRRLRATSVLPRRTLRPLQATWRDVVSQLRDRRLAAVEARRARTAPSELELAELAALRARRRWTLGVVAVLGIALDVVVLGTLAGKVLAGARLAGGSLAFGDADLGAVWDAATSWWSSGGLGQASPPEPLLVALTPLVALTGSLGGAVAVVMLGSLVLAALGAWFAAGAATRSVALRAFAALVWTAAPALLVALEQARLGAVLAHVALPWFLLALARGVGVARVDAVASGLVGARRLRRRAAAPVPVVDRARRYTFTDDADDAEDTDADAASGAQEAAETDEGDEAPEADVDATDDPSADEAPDDAAPADALPVTWAGVGRPPSTGTAEPSLAAAAGASLVLVVLTAAAPVMLPAVLLLLLAAAPVVRRRARLLWIGVPALVVHGPLVAEAVVHRTDGLWRLLVADPGVPVAAEVAPAWQQALGWPSPAPAWSTLPVTAEVAQYAPLVASGLLLVLALPALWLRAPVGRAARLGWVAVAIGTAAALTASRIVSGVALTADGQVTVTASASPGLSLALAGALTAVLVGASGVRSALARRPLGWRHGIVAILVVAALAGPLATLTAWTWRTRTDGLDLVAAETAAVPTVGRQLQQTAGLRVLRLAPDATGVTATVLDGNGPQLTETTRLVEVRRLLAATAGAEDPADRELADATARLAAGSSEDAAASLAALGVGAVLVPASGPGVDQLAAALDATPGLERVTQTAAGVIWRVAGASAGGAGWARVVEGDLATGATTMVLPDGRGTPVPAGGGARTLVLAERADGGWRAMLGSVRLRAVETTWRQAFELPDVPGEVTVVHAAPERVPWLAVQGSVLLVTLLLAVPLRRRKAVRR